MCFILRDSFWFVYIPFGIIVIIIIDFIILDGNLVSYLCINF